MRDPNRFVVDGKSIAHERTGNSKAYSWSRLRSALLALQNEYPSARIDVIVDASFPFGLEPNERDAYNREKQAWRVEESPAGTRADPIVLAKAEPDGVVVSLDRYKDYREAFPWLHDTPSRVWAATLINEADWMFQPVRLTPQDIRGTPQQARPRIAKGKAEEARRKAEAEAEAKRMAEEVAHRKAELEAEIKAEAKRKAEEEARRHKIHDSLLSMTLARLGSLLPRMYADKHALLRVQDVVHKAVADDAAAALPANFNVSLPFIWRNEADEPIHYSVTFAVSIPHFDPPFEGIAEHRRPLHVEVLHEEIAGTTQPQRPPNEEGKNEPFITKSIGMEFVPIPAGTLMMGFHNDGTPHRITINQPFYLGKYPVTQAQWKAVMGNNPSLFRGHPTQPVECVSWDDALAFLHKLSEREGGRDYSLPTEAQWESACRAGTQTPRYHQDIDAIAWYGENSNAQTQPVGQKLPNAWGLYDMLGNVWEWCHAGAVVDPMGLTGAGPKWCVARGGCWNSPSVSAAASFFSVYRGSRYGYFGFRCASSGRPK